MSRGAFCTVKLVLCSCGVRFAFLYYLSRYFIYKKIEIING